MRLAEKILAVDYTRGDFGGKASSVFSWCIYTISAMGIRLGYVNSRERIPMIFISLHNNMTNLFHMSLREY